MNCAACPYQRKIDALRKRCLACNPESDEGTPHGRVKADEFTLNMVPKAIDFDRTPSGMATTLKPEDEDKLRMAMSALFDLDPIDLLIVQHIMQGGSPSGFADKLKTIAHKAEKYRNSSSRQTVNARKRGILRKFPAFSAVCRNQSEHDAASRMLTELES